VTWTIAGLQGELEGSQDVRGACQYLDGPLDLIARYAAWWRDHVPAEQELVLYNQANTRVIPLRPGMSADEIEAALAA